MKRKYPVQLTEEQRAYLEKLISSGIAPARLLRRARILLKSDSSPGGPNWSYAKMREAFDVSDVTIAAVHKAFGQGGLEGALHRKKPDRIYEHVLDGEAEAHLIALACGQPPEGRERWTLRLLQGEMIRRQYVQSVSHETVRATLKKTRSSPG